MGNVAGKRKEDGEEVSQILFSSLLSEMLDDEIVVRSVVRNC